MVIECALTDTVGRPRPLLLNPVGQSLLLLLDLDRLLRASLGHTKATMMMDTGGHGHNLIAVVVLLAAVVGYCVALMRVLAGPFLHEGRLVARDIFRVVLLQGMDRRGLIQLAHFHVLPILITVCFNKAHCSILDTLPRPTRQLGQQAVKGFLLLLLAVQRVMARVVIQVGFPSGAY